MLTLHELDGIALTLLHTRPPRALLPRFTRVARVIPDPGRWEGLRIADVIDRTFVRGSGQCPRCGARTWHGPCPTCYRDRSVYADLALRQERAGRVS